MVKPKPDLNQTARIMVVDDHPMIRDGLVRLIGQQADMVSCGEAGSIAESRTVAGKQQPDLIILDLRLKGGDGLELIKWVKENLPSTRILVLSQFDGRVYVERALRAGAMGYVVKEQAAEEVLSAIRTVLAGEVYLTRGMAALLLHTFVGTARKDTRSLIETLSDRELHVMQLLGAGMSTREIAAELKLSFKTVETHRENIKRKLGLGGATELVHFATRWAQEHVALPSQTLHDVSPSAENRDPLAPTG
jgi:DNA-binding NarL/FixJ family response regulator